MSAYLPATDEFRVQWPTGYIQNAMNRDHAERMAVHTRNDCQTCGPHGNCDYGPIPHHEIDRVAPTLPGPGVIQRRRVQVTPWENA